MNPQTTSNGFGAIVYDADVLVDPDPAWFESAYWESRGLVSETAPGRGNAIMISAPFGEAVLRRYLRGGWAAKVSHDRYWYSGYKRSRPFVEFRVLADLHRQGLPVSRPLAAWCKRSGLTFTGSLMTSRLQSAKTLADSLSLLPPDNECWERVGSCIARFHQARVYHADLNARNILLGEEGQVYLIDFDRAQLDCRSWRKLESNLGRLHRSLNKLWPQDVSWRFEDCWGALNLGYLEGC